MLNKLKKSKEYLSNANLEGCINELFDIIEYLLINDNSQDDIEELKRQIKILKMTKANKQKKGVKK